MDTSPAYAPKLRRGLAAQPDRNGVVLFDQRRAGQPVHLSRAAFYDRLARIESVLGADLDDPDVRVSRHVALVADELLGGRAK